MQNDGGRKHSPGLSWDEILQRYGAKDEGMNPRARDEAVPERASDTERVSDFLRSFAESDRATTDMVAEVKSAVENGDFGVYAKLTNARLQANARNVIALKGVTKAQEGLSADVRANRK